MNIGIIGISIFFVLMMIFSAYSNYVQVFGTEQPGNTTGAETVNLTLTKIDNQPVNVTITGENGTQNYRVVDPCWFTDGDCIDPDTVMCKEFGTGC